MERNARRRQVLRHAKRIFARKGYHRTNIAEIVTRARIARGTLYLYFENKRDIFEELLEQVMSELRQRIRRLKLGPDAPDPAAQLRDNLIRVLTFVLREHELTDILVQHSLGFDRELDARIGDFYERVAGQIQRSLELGLELQLVRRCDTHAMAWCILGGIKEVVGQLLRSRRRDIRVLAEEVLAEEVLAEEVLAEEVLAEEVLAEEVLAEEVLAEEVLAFGLRGVARPELLQAPLPRRHKRMEAGGFAATPVD